MDPHLWHKVAAISGVAALGLGTYGAHAFKPQNPTYKEVWHTASLYHLVHTAALVAAPVTKRPNIFGGLLTTGIVAFSGTFHGDIENPKTNLKFPKLRIIDLFHNGFFGTLPSKYFQNWNAMKVVRKGNSTYMQVDKPLATVGANLLYSWRLPYSITISIKGTKRLYEKIQSVFVAVDLSDNKFNGKIPESLGSLCGLQALNISENNLTGIIPSSLANLTNLESLDLSQNLLSGEIPRQLTKLTFLSVLDVSHNRLTGPYHEVNNSIHLTIVHMLGIWDCVVSPSRCYAGIQKPRPHHHRHTAR